LESDIKKPETFRAFLIVDYTGNFAFIAFSVRYSIKITAAIKAVQARVLFTDGENGDQNPKPETASNPSPDCNIAMAENRCENVHLSCDFIEAGVRYP